MSVASGSSFRLPSSLVIHTCSFSATAAEAHVTGGGGLRLRKCSQKEGAACVLMDLVCSRSCSERTLDKVQGVG